MNGWKATGVYNAYHSIGMAADFGGNYGSVNGASARLNTYLFSPQVQLHGPVSPFAQALIGGRARNRRGRDEQRLLHYPHVIECVCG